ncbi:MAG: hypothetical protein HY645_11675 [Acidobacteria bacterium]|nr:hypothetical protein [Acidobacteriota bacterium]
MSSPLRWDQVCKGRRYGKAVNGFLGLIDLSAFEALKIPRSNHHTYTFAVALVLCGALLAQISCAKVGDPLPPLPAFAVPQDLAIVLMGKRVKLVFSPAAEEIDRVDVLRQAGSAPKSRRDAEVVMRVERGAWNKEEGGRFSVEHPLERFDQQWFYVVQFITPQGRRSQSSNVAVLPPIVPALPPQQLRATVLKDRVVLEWLPPLANLDSTAPPQIEGYLVNETHLVDDPRFEDQEIEFGKEKEYRVQTVTRRTDPVILSDSSEALSVALRDVFPPEAPQNVAALNQDGRVFLLWDANTEPDLHGYYIYRGTQPARLEKSSALVTINTYIDEPSAPGQTLYYQVSAVDQRGNESPLSSTVTIVAE